MLEISSKEITIQAMPDQGDFLENCKTVIPDHGDLLENCEGIKFKSSEVDNAVHSCHAGVGLLSGNSEKMPCGDRQHAKTVDLEAASSAVECSAILEMGNSDDSASLPLYKSKQNTLAVEIDDDFDGIENLRKVLKSLLFT